MGKVLMNMVVGILHSDSNWSIYRRASIKKWRKQSWTIENTKYGLQPIQHIKLIVNKSLYQVSTTRPPPTVGFNNIQNLERLIRDVLIEINFTNKIYFEIPKL